MVNNPKINPKTVKFTKTNIDFTVIQRAFNLYNRPNDVLPITYKEMEKFIENNDIFKTGKLIIRINNSADPTFFTIIKESNKIMTQLYVINDGFNKSLYRFSITYPDVNNETYEDDFFNNHELVSIAYGTLNSIKRYYNKWVLESA